MSITKAELETFIFAASFSPELQGLDLDSLLDSRLFAKVLAREIHDKLLRDAKPGR